MNLLACSYDARVCDGVLLTKVNDSRVPVQLARVCM